MTPPPSLARSFWPAWALLCLPLLLTDRAIVYDDHFEPAVLLLEQGGVPDPHACWECHQPPLYYALEAALFVLTGADSASSRHRAARLLTFALMVGLWAAGAAWARATARDERDRWTRLALFLTVPAFFMLHVTLGNDLVVISLAGLLFVLLRRWMREGGRASRARWLAAGLLCGLMFLGKYTGLAALPAALTAAWLARPVSADAGPRVDGIKARSLRVGLVLLGFGLLVAPWLGRNLAVDGHVLPLRMHQQTYEPLEPSYFLSFRFASLLAEPFTDPPGATFLDLVKAPRPCDLSLPTRAYSLWFNESLHYLPPLPPLLVSSLYAMGLLTLALFAWGAWATLRRRGAMGEDDRDERAFDRVALVFAVAALGLLLAFNLRYPSPHLVHGKAIFLLPAYAAFVHLYMVGLRRAGESFGGRLRLAVYSLHWILQVLFIAHALVFVMEHGLP